MNRIRLGILSFVCVAFGLLCGCSRQPDDVLDEEEMARLLADIHIGESVVEANSSQFTDDSVKRAFRQSIYARHGLTTEQVETSLAWYGYNMEKYVEVYDRVIEILNEDLTAAQERLGSAAPASADNGLGLSLEGDSVDVWTDVRFRPFTASMPNQISFVLRSEPNWETGDIYTFRSKLSGNSQIGKLTVAVDYSDGTMETYSSKMIGDGWHEARFGLDTLRQAREIIGSFQYDAAGDEIAFIDSISLTRTRSNTGLTSGRDGMVSFGNKRHSSKVD